MKSAEFVKAISCPPILPRGMRFLISNCSIGFAAIADLLSLRGSPGGGRRRALETLLLPALPAPSGERAGGARQIEHAGAEAEQEADNQTPRSRTGQPIDDPTEQSAGYDTRHELRGQPEGLP